MNSPIIFFPFSPIRSRSLVNDTTGEQEALLTKLQYRVLRILALALVFLMSTTDPAFAMNPDDSSVQRIHGQSSGHRDQARRRSGNATPKVYGKTIGNWGHAWWQWVSNFAAGDDPISQDGVVDCTANQSGKVWYLAGTFGGSANRTCSIKKGKAIFLPLFNGIFWTPIDPNIPEDCVDETSCRGVSANIDTLTGWTCTVDGTPCAWFAQIVRAQSDARSFDIPDGSSFTAFGYAPGLRKISVADGYWVMLDPLPPGEHQIHFTSTATAFGGFSLDVTYHLTVN